MYDELVSTKEIIYKEMKHEQVIYGSVPSKSNCYKIITLGGHGSLAKTQAMKEFEKKFYLQCGAYRNKNIQGFFELYADVYFQSNVPQMFFDLHIRLEKASISLIIAATTINKFMGFWGGFLGADSLLFLWFCTLFLLLLCFCCLWPCRALASSVLLFL